MAKASPKVLIFDLDDTLVVEKASAAATLVATCEHAARRYDLDPRALHVSVREACRELWHHHCPARRYAVDVGISSWEALWSRFEGDHERLPTLRAWAADYRLNSWRCALRAHGVEDLDLARELAEAVMLGDSQSKDVQGAQAVGMKAVWVNRAGVPRRDGIAPDLEVATLTECVSQLTAIGSRDALTEKQNESYHGR